MTTTTGRRAATGAALHAAAREVFAEKGYLNAKISDITARAGRSVGSFYNHYETKQQLLEAMLERFPADIVERATSDLSGDLTTDVEGAVRAYVATFREHLPEMIGALQLSMTDASAAAWWRSQRAEGIRAVRSVIDRVEHDGGTVDLHHTALASAIVGMLESWCWTWMAAGGDDVTDVPDEETAVATLAQIWLRALGSPTPR